MQEEGTAPEWFSTGGWQLFKDKYLYQATTPKEQYQRIATTAAKHIKGKLPHPEGKDWSDVFFNLFWSGTLSGSTPVLANMGTDRGLPVSCSGSYTDDSIDSIYATKRETAILTKHGFGTASKLNVRPRGSLISGGGKSLGVLPVVKGFVEDMRYVSQGNSRRGAFASYIDIDHDDVPEVCKYAEQNPDDLNIGWVVSQDFIDKLDQGCPDTIGRYQDVMQLKMITGKGYFFFKDKANAQRPAMYKELGLEIEGSQLCSEIVLHSSPEYTYTCVLSSMNVALFDGWKDTLSVFEATVFLDCVVEEFLVKARKIHGLEKAVAFTEKSRALGLGACGLGTLFQKRGITFESFEAHMLNTEIFSYIKEQSTKATEYMADYLGEPEWCTGHKVRNTHTLAVAPTKSTALIMGGVSEGINPDAAMSFTQLTPAGEIDRFNPVLLDVMKKEGVYNKKNLQEVVDSKGSVQDVDWLSDELKAVFKTAFEINQEAILRMASVRQTFICQGQSLNLFFSSDEKEEVISAIHQKAFKDPNINALYYCYSKRGVSASKGECEACQ